MDLVLPEHLWGHYVPQQFSTVISREFISQFLIGYLREGYEHSVQIKELVEGVKGKGGLGSFIEDKVTEAITDVAKIEPTDGANISWAKEVLQKLLDKEKGNDEKPITHAAILIIYAIFGKLLSGGLASLGSLPYIPHNPVDPKLLKDNINKSIQIIRESYYELNDLQDKQDYSGYTRLTKDKLVKFLEIEGSPLQKDETVHSFLLDKADPTGTILKITIKNQAGDERHKTIDVRKFAYWELAHQAIDKIIPDDDLKELVPHFLQKMITKELLAAMSANYVEACHKIQGPLHKEAELGEELAEDLEDLKPLIDKLIIGRINEKLDTLASEKEPLVPHLPIFFETLFKNLLSHDNEVKKVRDILIRRAIYVLLAELLKPGDQDKSAEDRSVENIREKLQSVITAFPDLQASPEKISTKIVDLLIPQATWDKIFTGKFKDLVTRKQLAELINNHLTKESCAKIDTIKDKHAKAVKVIEELDRKAGLTGCEGGS